MTCRSQGIGLGEGANVYLALAGMLMAGLDGVESNIDPASNNFGPYDVDIAKQDAAFLSRVATLPRSLCDAMDALQNDHEFLVKGEVFPQALIEDWIALKRRDEADKIATRPHPYEYELYLDV